MVKRLFGYALRQDCQGQTPFREWTTFLYSSFLSVPGTTVLIFSPVGPGQMQSHCFQCLYLWSTDPCKVPETSLVCPHDPLHTLVPIPSVTGLKRSKQTK